MQADRQAIAWDVIWFYYEINSLNNYYSQPRQDLLLTSLEEGFVLGEDGGSWRWLAS